MSNLITVYFEADHQRLDCLYNAFKQHFANQDIDLAKHYFIAFKKGIEQHIVWEESTLFPFFEKHSGIEDGTTRIMTLEHQQVYRLNSAIIACFEQQLCSKIFQTALENLLEEHNHKEEHLLYPTLDTQCCEQQKAAIFLELSKRSFS